jgi:8-oxo-dGTP pyrophosphatase MutT (NUDIX family)
MDLKFEPWNDPQTMLHTPIFDVVEESKKAPNGKNGTYVKIKAPNWVSAVVERTQADFCERFVMTAQHRHGVDEVLTEFPCGMVEEGETALDAILRECEEEIGLDRSKVLEIKKLYEANPNPAFMDNKMTCFYIKVEGLCNNQQSLDENEFVEKRYCSDSQVENIMKLPNTSVMMKLAWEEYKNKVGGK